MRYFRLPVIWTRSLSVPQLLAILCGLLTPVWLPQLPAWPAWIGFTAGGLMLVVRQLRIPALYVLASVWACWCAERSWQVVPKTQYNQSQVLIGTVVDIPVQTADRLQFAFQVEHPPRLSGKRLRINWYRTEQPMRSGERWQLEVRLRPPVGAINPYGFDYARYLLASGISGTGVVRNASRIDPSPAFGITAARVRLIEWLQDSMPEDTSALARALLVGDRSAIDANQREQLIATGTAHLLAISGMHVGLVAWFGYCFGRWLYALLIWMVGWFASAGRLTAWIERWLSAHSAGILMALLIATAYACLAGLVVSTRRALLMLMVVFLAVLLRRHVMSGRTLLLAAIVVLTVNPLIALGPAFWLSFGAVFWLWYGFSGRNGQWLGVKARVRSLLEAQGLLFIGLLPVQLLWFQQASLSMLVANLFAIPLVSLLILPLLLVAAVGQISSIPLHETTLAIVDKLLELLIYLLDLLQNYSVAPFHHVPAGFGVIALGVAGALLLLAPRGVPLRWLGVVLLLPLCVTASSEALQQGEWRATVFDAGQGQAVAIRTQSQLLLYDTGPGDGRGRDSAAGSILPLLHSWQQPLDRLIVSHSDLDHAGGLASVMQAFPEVSLLSSAPSFGQLCVSNQHWEQDGVKFTILHPSRYLPYLRNDSSCVLLVESAGGSLLLPGDISQQIEHRLLLEYPRLQADVLLVPHHGSKSSSSEALLQQLQPQLAIASTGLWNRYAFPRPEVVQRYQHFGIHFYTTADCGAMTVASSASGQPEIRRAGHQWLRWWQQQDGLRNCLL